MKNSTDKIQTVRVKALISMKKTADPQQALAQIDAALSRQENQKVTEKSQNL